MTHIITRACCNDAACVPVCPVNCIHPTPDEPDYGTAEMLYIDPDGCVDCGACVDVCPVGAIVADYDLTDDFARYEEINARYFSDPAHAEYDAEPQTPPRRVWDLPSAEPLKVAVVGSGPAACYAAEELMSQRGLAVQVDIFERLPTPGGLVRFGVAPDHQDTKAAGSAFARTLRRRGVRLFLNAEVGRDVSFEALRSRYHAVVVAVGAMDDRPLGIAGEGLPGSHSATEFVAWYNGHPDYADRTFDLGHERAVVIGNGNVALDVARILVSDPEALARTDIADHALEQLRKSTVKEVVVVGRRGPLEAAFTTKELLGLAETPAADLVVRPEELRLSEDQIAAAGERSVALYKVELMAELGTRTPSHERRITLRFLASPDEIRGDGWVESVRLTRNELVADQGRTVARPTGDVEELACGLVFRSVGYRGRGIAGLPFDEARGIIPNEAGRILDPESGAVLAGLYVAGWIKRGPSGVIGTNKRCARETVTQLLADLEAGRLPALTDDRDVAESVPGHLDLEGWKAIDDYERSEGKAQRRPRVKLTDVAHMLEVARG